MFELNARIRKFQERGTSNFQKEDNSGTAAEADRKVVMEVVVEPDLRTLDNMLAHVVSQTTKEEQEYIAEQNIQKQIQQEYVDLQRKISLMEVIMKETKALQDLTRQTCELEQTYASIGEELQKRCLCPACHEDNMEFLGGILQAN